MTKLTDDKRWALLLDVLLEIVSNQSVYSEDASHKLNRLINEVCHGKAN